MRRRELLALGGLAALVAACGNDDASATSEVELQFTYWGSTFEQKAVEKMLKAFEKNNKGTKVKPLFTPDEYDVKLNTLVASGSVPDVGYVPMAMSYRLAEQGKVVNLFPHLRRYPQLAGYRPDAYLWYGKDQLHGVATANEIELLWYSRSAIAAAGISAPPAQASGAWTPAITACPTCVGG